MARAHRGAQRRSFLAEQERSSFLAEQERSSECSLRPQEHRVRGVKLSRSGEESSLRKLERERSGNRERACAEERDTYSAAPES